MFLSACAVALHLLLSSSGDDTDWPQWRGPNRNGHAVGARLPVRWPETFPAPQWRAPVGIGYSSPVIAGGRLFIMGRDTSGNEVCYAFDAATGKPLWSHRYPSTFEPPDPTAGKGPNSTPTVDKDRVYMLGLGGMFHCLDVKTGRVLWKHDLEAEYWGVEKDAVGQEAWRPVCGASASALVDGREVIVPVGGKKAGAFAGFDRATGRLLRKSLDDRSSYASPLRGELAGVSQIVGFTGTRMVGLDARNRNLLWEHPFKAMYEQTIITPVLRKNQVIVCGEARPTVALEIANENGKWTAKTAWQNADLSAYLTTPVVFGERLLGYDQKTRRPVCIDPATGTTVWTGPRIGRMFMGLTVVGDRILALSDSGELLVLEANPQEYKEIGRWKLAAPGTIWSLPALVGNRLYIRDQESVTCFELPSAG
ncbi:MAG: PQQ-binding-like beta-propeller repeat protein [Capsulimonadales bacterium]|nr:PQQ-binding-like beta-propeller repeat protein [Capsulimonadales bacterium]